MSLTETAIPAPASVTAKSPKVNPSVKNDLPRVVEWKNYEKVLFRFFFTYFLLQTVPLDWKFYRDIFLLDWSSLHFGNLFYVARYSPRVFSDAPVFADWLLLALLAVIVTITWNVFDAKAKEYNKLYYVLRTILRYRLAIALLAYGFIKFFPLQMPEPSISNLNTNYGDITHWKVFSMSTGIVPGYQSFLGLVEILAALLLLNRKTASIGAFIVIPFTGNVVMSNLAYEGGEYVYSLLLVSFAIAIFVYDLPRLASLAFFEKKALPPEFRPAFPGSLKHIRLIGKSVVVLLALLYGFRVYDSYREEIYHFPSSPGLAGAAGIYNVTSFTLNGKEYPYAAHDAIRWRDVVFEKWATLSIRSGAPVELTRATTEEIFRSDEDRSYEFAGIAGRHYYTYRTDTINNRLVIANRNRNHSADSSVFSFERPTRDRIILSGVNARNDSLRVVLDRIPKKYLLEEAARQGRRGGLKL